MSVFRRFSYVMGLLFFVMLTLPGCKSSNKLENGVVKTNISGNASSALEFKFTLPVNVEALMIQTSANDQVVLQLLDVNKNPIPGCEQATLCLREYPGAGDYFLRLSALSQVSNLSLVASWSGPAAATLKNAVPVTGLKGGTGTVILQSLHIPFHIGELTLENSGAGSYRLELLDQTGAVLHSCNANVPCSLSQRFDGNYFVRITGLATFENLNLRASWGGANQSTLKNGIPKKGLSGAAGTEHFESVYLQPGTQALMVQKSPSDRPASVSILDADGDTVQNCWDECLLNAPEPGLHYIRIVYEDYVSDLSVTAMWGGENESLLKNGVPLTGLGGNENDVLLASVYLPEGTLALMLQTSGGAPVELELIDQQGNQIWNGWGGYSEPAQIPQPGLYFVRMWLMDNISQFKLTAAWGSNDQGTLQNGIPLTGLSGNENDVLLASVYLPEGTLALMLQTSGGAPVELELIDQQGNQIWNGWGSYSEPAQIPQPGLYFVRMRLMDNISQFKLTAAWGSNDQGTLQNGIPLTGLSGNENDVLLASVYLPEGTLALMLQTSGGAPVELELIDQQGNQIWNGWGSYSEPAQIPQPGLYFVRMWLMDNISQFKLTAAWGSNDQGTLQNGIPLTGLSGNENDVLLASVYLPEGTTALMLQTSGGAPVELELIDQQGNQIWNGWGSYSEPAQIPQPGLYFVRMWLMDNISQFKLTAAWGSNNQGTLQNGIPLTGLSGNENDVLLASVYLPEGTTALMLQTSGGAPVELELIDQQGNQIWNGWGGYSEPAQIPQPGLYFVRMRLMDNISQFKLTAAWGSNNQGTLQNGIPLTGLSGNENDVLLASVYLPEGTTALMLQTSGGAPVELELIDQQGNQIWNGWGDYGNPVQIPQPGLYFVRMQLQQDVASFSLNATWGVNQQGLLQNGIPFTGLSGKENDIRLISVYVPVDAQSLLLDIGTFVDIELDLLDANGNFLWSGHGAYTNAIQNLPAGLYFVRMRLRQDVESFALSATWGTNQQGLLQNGVPLAGLSGKALDSRLASVYLPEDSNTLLLRTGTIADIELDLFDASGNQVWRGHGTYADPIQDLPAGLYFVRVQLMQDIESYTLSASWGGNAQGLLQNGVALDGLGGKRHDTFVASFRIPEGTQALLLQSGMDFGVQLQLLDQQGNSVWNGAGNSIDPILQPQPGLYFVRMDLTADVASFKFTAAWVTNNQGTLQNGVPLNGFNGKPVDVLVASVYIPEGTAALTLQTDPSIFTSVIDQSGWDLLYLPGASHTIHYPPAGPYFIRMLPSAGSIEFSMQANW